MNVSSSSGPTLSIPSYPSPAISKTVSYAFSGEIVPPSPPPSSLPILHPPQPPATPPSAPPECKRNTSNQTAQVPLHHDSGARGMAARFPCSRQTLKRPMNRLSARQCFTPRSITALQPGLPQVRSPTLSNLFVRKSLSPSSLHGQRHQDSRARIHARPRPHTFRAPHPCSTPVLHIIGQPAWLSRITTNTFPAVFHSSTRPEPRDDPWSNRTLPRELAILLCNPTQTKQGDGYRTPSYHDPDASLQRKPGRSLVGLTYFIRSSTPSHPKTGLHR